MADVQSLLFASAAARVGFVLIFVVACFKSEARQAFRFWTASITGSAVSVLLVYSDPSYPYYPAVRGAVIYTVIGFSMSCVWAGGGIFFGCATAKVRFTIMGFMPGMVYGFTRALGAPPDLVVLLVIATLAYSSATIARLFLRRRQRHYLPSQVLVGVALTAYSVVLAFSAILIAVKLLVPGVIPDTRSAEISLSLFIDQIASVLVYVGLIAMSLEDAQDRIMTLATTDSLTGLANRRGVQEQTAAVISACRRANRPAAVFIADLDHFKSINDRYGHNGGDAVLTEFARRLSAYSRRGQDVTGRWGGEEFLAVVGNMTLADATSFADGFRRHVSETSFDIGNERIAVTVSIGVAAVDCRDPSLGQAVREADEALYDAKRNGRNRVSSHTDNRPTVGRPTAGAAHP